MSKPSYPGLGQFLQEYGLTDMGLTLMDKLTLQEMHALLFANRPFFLERLKAVGITRPPDRQKLANALSKASKAGAFPPPNPLPHLHPCIFTETAETLTIRLTAAAGVKSHQVQFSVDVNSVSVTVLGERTALCGHLSGIVKPKDCSWEIERTKPPEYDPLLTAAEYAKPH